MRVKPSQIRLGLLAAAVVALAALVVWQWRAEHAKATLLTLDPAAVTRIAVTWQGKPIRRYRKRGGHWYLAGQSERRADDAHMAALAGLAATSVIAWRERSDVQPAAIGLAMPAVIVTLNGQRLAYGALAAFGPQRYVRVGERIAVIPASYSPRPPPAASSSTAASSQKS
jgi:hypothetical protein